MAQEGGRDPFAAPFAQICGFFFGGGEGFGYFFEWAERSEASQRVSQPTGAKHPAPSQYKIFSSASGQDPYTEEMNHGCVSHTVAKFAHRIKTAFQTFLNVGSCSPNQSSEEGKIKTRFTPEKLWVVFFFFGKNYLYLSSSPWLVYFLYISLTFGTLISRQLFIPRASGESSCGPTFGAGSPGLGGWGGTWRKANN